MEKETPFVKSNETGASKKLNGKAYKTWSGLEVKPFYTPEDLLNIDYPRDIGNPGDYPYTRGIHRDMYRTKLWTMRQFSGYGSAKDTNQRLQLLLTMGETGLSIAFDLPTLLGYDSDHPRAFGEVGKCGVAIDSLQDMEELFEGIPLDRVSTSMTINGPAAILFAMLLVLAQKRGIRLKDLRGTIQNDILKEYISQNTYIFPPRPSLRIFTDLLKFATVKTPNFNTISISGYHIREAGSSAVQELAFTMANGFTYVEEGIRAGLKVDQFVPRFSFFFNSHMDFFEEIAKFRAARRIWARAMKEKYKAKDPKSWTLRFHAQTAGCSLTKQQPENNIIRTGIESLAAVLGGAQSLHTNSLDETLALPSSIAAQIALRTQQIIAWETRVANVADPLGGSFYLESLTNRMEEEAENYLKKIEAEGGVIPCIETGFFQKEISNQALKTQKEIENQEKIVVGVNQFQQSEGRLDFPILKIGIAAEKGQVEKLRALRRSRSRKEVESLLRALRLRAKSKNNLMPKIMDAVRAYATLGEICSALKEVFGEYDPPSVF